MNYYVVFMMLVAGVSLLSPGHAITLLQVKNSLQKELSTHKPADEKDKKVALSAALFKILNKVDKGGDSNIRGKGGVTPLMLAAFLNDRMAVEYLLAHGADSSLVNNKGEKAEDMTKDEFLKLSLKDNIFLKNADEAIAFVNKIEEGISQDEKDALSSVRKIKQILQLPKEEWGSVLRDDGRFGLGLALELNKIALVRFFLNQELAPTTEMLNQSMYGASTPWMVDLMLMYGADINGVNRNFGTALIEASGRGDMAQVKYLISLGAAIGYQREINHGGSPLHSALASKKWDVAKFFVEKGEDLNSFVEDRGRCHNYKQYEAEIKKKEEEESELLAFLAQNNFSCGVFYLSALTCAMKCGPVEQFEYLLKKDVPLSVDWYEHSPLSPLIRNLEGQNGTINGREYASKEDSKKMLALAFKAGADIKNWNILDHSCLSFVENEQSGVEWILTYARSFSEQGSVRMQGIDLFLAFYRKEFSVFEKALESYSGEINAEMKRDICTIAVLAIIDKRKDVLDVLLKKYSFLGVELSSHQDWMPAAWAKDSFSEEIFDALLKIPNMDIRARMRDIAMTDIYWSKDESIERMLKKGLLDLTEKDEQGYIAFWRGLKGRFHNEENLECHLRMLKMLMPTSFDMNQEDKYGFTPLNFLCNDGGGYYDQMQIGILACIDFLIEHGADINKAVPLNQGGYEGMTPFMLFMNRCEKDRHFQRNKNKIAIVKKGIDYFLSKGANPHAKTPQGKTVADFIVEKEIKEYFFSRIKE